MDPQTLGGKPKVKERPKGLICPSNGLPKWSFDVGLIIQGLNLHLHAKKHTRNQCQPLDKLKTSGGMDELVTRIKRPTFRMDNVQPM